METLYTIAETTHTPQGDGNFKAFRKYATRLNFNLSPQGDGNMGISNVLTM